MTSDEISYNFSVVKVLSILMVATGHFGGGILWIPTTIALFIFAFSSGFFTALKYSGDFSIAKFWQAKFLRIGYNLFLINVFLLILFLIQDKTGIISWHTILAVLGLNGFLNWFGIHNNSPFGMGLWFFTVLWLYYLIYPVFERVLRSKFRASVFILLSFIIFTILHYSIKMGHMLWMTAFAFTFGTYSARYRFFINPLICAIIGLGTIIFMIFLNLWLQFSTFNYLWILICSIMAVYLLMEVKLPNLFFNKFLFLSSCVMEIYFIHTYLFIPYLRFNRVIIYVLSMIMIICVSLIISKLSNKLSLLVKKMAGIILKHNII